MVQICGLSCSPARKRLGCKPFAIVQVGEKCSGSWQPYSDVGARRRSRFATPIDAQPISARAAPAVIDSKRQSRRSCPDNGPGLPCLSASVRHGPTTYARCGRVRQTRYLRGKPGQFVMFVWCAHGPGEMVAVARFPAKPARGARRDSVKSPRRCINDAKIA